MDDGRLVRAAQTLKASKENTRDEDQIRLCVGQSARVQNHPILQEPQGLAVLLHGELGHGAPGADRGGVVVFVDLLHCAEGDDGVGEDVLAVCGLEHGLGEVDGEAGAHLGEEEVQRALLRAGGGEAGAGRVDDDAQVGLGVLRAGGGVAAVAFGARAVATGGFCLVAFYSAGSGYLVGGWNRH